EGRGGGDEQGGTPLRPHREVRAGGDEASGTEAALHEPPRPPLQVVIAGWAPLSRNGQEDRAQTRPSGRAGRDGSVASPDGSSPASAKPDSSPLFFFAQRADPE